MPPRPLGITLDQLIEMFTAESAIKRTNTVEEMSPPSRCCSPQTQPAASPERLYSIDGWNRQAY